MFGAINPQMQGSLYTSGIATMTCTDLEHDSTYSACLDIDKGDARGSTESSRTLSYSKTAVPIVISNSASAPLEIGTGKVYPPSGPFIFLTNGASRGSVNFPISVQLNMPLAAGPGIYSNNFTGPNFRARFGRGTFADCGQMKTKAHGGQLLVTASIVAGCVVSASAMNFGVATLLAVDRLASTTITLNCTEGVTATVGLDNGQTGTEPTSRLMRSGNQTVHYGIYRDSAQTLPFGNTAGIDTVRVTMGTATTANVTAFGKVPVQTVPSPGNYMDIVNVVVSF